MLKIEHLKKYLAQDKTFKDMILFLQDALMTHPDDTQLIQNFIFNYSKIGDYENVVVNLKKLLGQNPGKPDIYYNIACMYAKMERIDESVAWLDLAIKKGFNNWTL